MFSGAFIEKKKKEQNGGTTEMKTDQRYDKTDQYISLTLI
jgi:hypothetical protein